MRPQSLHQEPAKKRSEIKDQPVAGVTRLVTFLLWRRCHGAETQHTRTVSTALIEKGPSRGRRRRAGRRARQVFQVLRRAGDNASETLLDPHLHRAVKPILSLCGAPSPLGSDSIFQREWNMGSRNRPSNCPTPSLKTNLLFRRSTSGNTKCALGFTRMLSTPRLPTPRIPPNKLSMVLHWEPNLPSHRPNGPLTVGRAPVCIGPPPPGMGLLSLSQAPQSRAQGVTANQPGPRPRLAPGIEARGLQTAQVTARNGSGNKDLHILRGTVDNRAVLGLWNIG